MNIELAAIGLVIGIFIGVSGVGGGSIMTPVLILVLGINPLVAVGTDLHVHVALGGTRNEFVPASAAHGGLCVFGASYSGRTGVRPADVGRN